MVPPQQVDPVREEQLQRKQHHDNFDRILAPVDVITEEDVIACRWVTECAEDRQNIVDVAVNIANNNEVPEEVELRGFSSELTGRMEEKVKHGKPAEAIRGNVSFAARPTVDNSENNLFEFLIPHQ